jgi:hypothetical protein
MSYGVTVNTWTTKLDGKQFIFRFEHQFWTGRKSYYIDGELVRHVRGGIIESGTRSDKTDFTIGTHHGTFEYTAKTENALVPGSVLTDDNGISQICTLTIDGSLIALDADSTNIDDKQASRYPRWLDYVFIGMILGMVLYYFVSN